MSTFWLLSMVVYRGTALSDSTPLASEHRLIILEFRLAERFTRVKEREAPGVFLLVMLLVVVFFLAMQADDDVHMSHTATAASNFAKAAFVMETRNLVLAIDSPVLFTAEFENSH